MINLLPAVAKQELRAGRLNVILLRYLVILALAIAFLGLVVSGAYLILNSVQANAQSLIDSNQSKSSSYSSVQAQATALQNNLTGAKTILGSNIDYAKLIVSIGGLIPSGVILNELSLSPSVFGTPTSLQADAKTTDDALALKTALQNSSIFSNVSLKTLASSGGTSDYPISISLEVTINSGATHAAN